MKSEAVAKGRPAPQGGEASWLLGTLFGSFFITLYLVPLLFALLYHSMPTLVLAIVGAKILAALVPLGRPNYSVLIGLSVAALLGAAAAGLHIYYAYSLPLMNLKDGRTYHQVYAQQPAAAFSDAAALTFAGNVTVDDTKALGMSTLDVGLHTFCVAPIVDDQSLGRAEFWAVGLDCCKNRGDFVCDDAGMPHVRSGVVLTDRNHDDLLFHSFGNRLAPAMERRDLFLKAVRRAEHVHGIVSAKSPVLLRWTATSRESLIDKATSRLAVALFVAALVCGLVALFLTAIAYNVNAADKNEQSHIGSYATSMNMPVDTPLEVIQFVNNLGSTSASGPAATRSNHDIILLGFVTPLFVLVTSVVLWTWLRCWKFGEMAAILFGCLSLVAAAALASTPRKFIYGMLLLFCAVKGAYIGNMNYLYNTFHYCSVSNHRTYNDVPASASSSEYRDAGKIYFESAATINIEDSLGLRIRGHTYCAAPIIGPGNDIVTPAPSGAASAPAADNALQPDAAATAGIASTGPPTTGATYSMDVPNVDFWAVGVDCCDSRGNFKCAGDGSIAAGLVFRNAGEMDERYANFVRSVRATADNYNLPPPKNPILIQWSAEADGLRAEWAGRALGVCLMVTVVGIAVLAVFSTSLWCCGRCKSKAEKDAMLRKQQFERMQQQKANPQASRV